MTTASESFAHESSNSESSGSYIIGIGASAGGLEAIKVFFDNVPASCKYSFILIQHLSPDHKSLMADLLQRNTQLPIHEAVDGMSVERGSIYLIPPKKNLELQNGLLVLSDKPTNNSLNLPIDIFFRSLAQEQGPRSIGVILTGTGSDGTRGVRAIKEAGGMVMVQDPIEAMFDGMPLSAINTGLVDYVLPVDELPLELQSFVEHPVTVGAIDGVVETDPAQLSLIIARMKQVTDLDFTHYKKPTLVRRVQRRMGIKKCDSLDQYLDLIQKEPREAEILSRECLIGVTKFFRDPGMWETLASEVLPDLVTQKHSERQPIRIWSVGCSTGEEVYTMAILLDEEMQRQGRHCEAKIFGTDLSEQHLAIASKGQYSESIIADVQPDRLHAHFVKRGEEYQTTESLRSMAIFSPHNVIKDPPFKDIDIVVCRNMLIYLKPVAQQKAIASLHYSLKLNGTLFLGPSESIGDFKLSLKEIDAKSKLYRNDNPSRGFGFDMLKYPDLQPVRPGGRTTRHTALSTRTTEVLAEALTEELGLAAVFIDESFDILHAAGEIRNFAELPQQGFSSNLLKLLDNNLSAAVSTAVRKAKLQTTEVHYKGVRVVRDDETTKVNIVVRPFNVDGPDWRQCYAVIFIPQAGDPGKLTEAPLDYSVSAAADRVTEVEQELKDTRESLQAAIEELETTNEELQATNEELMAANEELQSTNEELQSVNEELHTVNSEHQQKMSDLAELNGDMDNLLQSTEIGTIFLDREMRIRRFTPIVQDQFNLREMDIGRPLAHFTNTFTASENDRLLSDASRVLESGAAQDVEFVTRGEKTELVKLAPFRARSGEIDGVVMSFIDVTELQELKNVQAELEKSNHELKQFAYLTSHDLQEPLRTVSNFVEVLGRRYNDALDDDGRQYLGIVAQATGRMQGLIRGILDYSRIGRDGVQAVVDIDSVIDDVTSDLSSSISASEAEVRANDLPKVVGYESELRTLFTNLISNAIKFRHPERPPEITIGARRLPEAGWRFSISDNGIGVPAEYQDRIFEIFNRLHTQEEYEGSGIGLAHCRKIVELHDGSITVESLEDAGSTFHFTLNLQ